MSSGDTAVVPSSTTNSDTNKLPPSNVAEAIEQDHIDEQGHIDPGSSLDSDKQGKANLPSSVSDFDLHEQSQMPSNSNSLESMAPSLEAEEVGEILKRENAKSAFEITSFRPATEDLDKSGAGRPTSTDSLTLHTVIEKGESEETVIASSKKPQLTNTHPEDSPPNNTNGKPVEKETPANELLEVGNEASQGNVASSPKTVPTIPEEPASKPSAHPQSGTAAQPGNGAGVQPNRFRRVNQYDRGRWTIRDSLVTEQQSEGLLPHQQQSLPSEGMNSRQSSLHSTKHQDSSESSNGTTPPLKSTQQRFDATTMGPVEPPQLQIPTELNTLSGITGGGLAPDSTSDRDSSSIHMDRSSTAAETLSRNTSMSSIVAPEKSVDGDELLRDIDADSMSGIMGNQNSSQDQEVNDMPMVSPQPPVVATSSSGAVPPPSSTALPRDDQQGSTIPREDQQGAATGSAPE